MNSGTRGLKHEFMRYIVPSVLAQWVYALYTMVDGMFVANGVNEIALTAVNLCFPYVAALFSLSLLFAVGTSTVVAIFLGRDQKERAFEVFTQNVVIQLVLSGVIILLVMTNLERVAVFLGAPNRETMDYVVGYLKYVVPFSTAFLLSYSFEILLKIDGYPQKAMIIVTVGAVENCILDWLFVMVLDKGIEGAAFATGFSQATVVVLYLQHFLSGKGVLRFGKFRFSLPVLGRVVRNGFSSGITELSTGFMVFVFNQVVLTYLNQDALVSYTIIGYVSNLVLMSTTGIAQGGQPLLSYYYGQGDSEKCRKLCRYTVITAAVFCSACLVLCQLGADVYTSFFISASRMDLRQSSAAAFRIYTMAFLPAGFNIAVSGYFTSVERPYSALIISAGRSIVLMIGCLLVMAKLFGGIGIWSSVIVSESLCLVIAAGLWVRYSRKDGFWNGKL